MESPSVSVSIPLSLFSSLVPVSRSDVSRRHRRADQPLGVLVVRRDVVARERAHLAVAHACPPVGVGVLRDLDDVAAPESQLPGLLGVEVKQRLNIHLPGRYTEGGALEEDAILQYQRVR